MRIAFPIVAMAASLLIAACAPGTNDDAPMPLVDDRRPNILLVVADDLGYSDLGSFGGEIATPTLDRLALNGIRFSNFYSAPMCSPARAMLLTGVDSHLAGFGNMLEELSPNQKGQPGYEGYLNDRVVTVSELLQRAGYRTYMSGKWHLGTNEQANPAVRGFDRSFALGSGGASHFADMRPAYAPSPEIKANYWADGKKLEKLPDGFNYSSQFYVDQIIENLRRDEASDRPFFAYLSFTAPHWPLQAPDAAIARQKGRYDEGYDVLATRRLERQKEMGLVPGHATRASRSPKESPWEDLDDNARRTEIRAMEIYAAMIAEVDVHTGRLIDYLESKGLLENTVVIFVSDNGPEGHDLDETWPADAFPEIRHTIDTTHDFSYENMGRVGSYTLHGPNWANAVSPAFRLFKGFPTEGGTHVSAFVYSSKLVSQPAVVDDFVFVKDVTPTILNLAGVPDPAGQYAGRDVERMTGTSFAAMLSGKPSDDQPRTTGIELLGKRAIRSGDWKLIHMPVPYGTGNWQLFNIADDPSESKDLADEFPDVVTELSIKWKDYERDNKVIIPDWVSGY